jgi:hypothetical protein
MVGSAKRHDSIVGKLRPLRQAVNTLLRNCENAQSDLVLPARNSTDSRSP